MTLLWIIIAIVAILVIWAVADFNRLVTFKARANEAWADIDVQLKRRYDLIPNLVNTVKGYAAHESGTLEAVVAARASAMQSSGNLADKSQAESQLTNSLKSIFALAENYPNLKANENFLGLQNELSDTENKIQAARRFYNGIVRDYNTVLKIFPSNIIAGAFHFEVKEFFQLGNDDAAKNPVEVKF